MNKVLLIILDGWGYAPTWGGNPLSIANKPYYDYLWRFFPRTLISASGTDVGLPGHEMGNSEVGHMNIGAGRIVRQDILTLNKAAQDGTFYKNKILTEAMHRVNGTSGNLHIMGILSDGGIHGHINHAIALLKMAKLLGVKQVYVHVFTDGRDTPPMSSQIYITRLEKEIKELSIGKISTIIGRYYAMDRDNKWSRIDKAYRLLTENSGQSAKTAISAVSQSYAKGITDEFIEPTYVLDNSQKPPPVKSGDSVIFWNFRSDRSRQITQAFLKSNIDGYKRHIMIKNLYFITMIPYGYEQDAEVRPFVAFSPDRIKITLASVLSANKIPQFHIAETEKYAHITYFFNGTVEQPYPLEDRKIIPSPRVATYDMQPQMSAPLITQSLLYVINTNKYPFIVVNYANADMVGHTGNYNAGIAAIECIDAQLRQVIEKARKCSYYSFITADHGNIEVMLDPISNEPGTEHTNNKVPFILVPPDEYYSAIPADNNNNIVRGNPRTENVNSSRSISNNITLRPDGRLADITPTLLDTMHIQKPAEMTGKSLIQEI